MVLVPAQAACSEVQLSVSLSKSYHAKVIGSLYAKGMCHAIMARGAVTPWVIASIPMQAYQCKLLMDMKDVW